MLLSFVGCQLCILTGVVIQVCSRWFAVSSPPCQLSKLGGSLQIGKKEQERCSFLFGLGVPACMLCRADQAMFTKASKKNHNYIIYITRWRWGHERANQLREGSGLAISSGCWFLAPFLRQNPQHGPLWTCAVILLAVSSRLLCTMEAYPQA